MRQPPPKKKTFCFPRSTKKIVQWKKKENRKNFLELNRERGDLNHSLPIEKIARVHFATRLLRHLVWRTGKYKASPSFFLRKYNRYT